MWLAIHNISSRCKKIDAYLWGKFDYNFAKNTWLHLADVCMYGSPCSKHRQKNNVCNYPRCLLNQHRQNVQVYIVDGHSS